MRLPICLALLLCAPAPLAAFEDAFETTGWDAASWVRRLPLSGSRANRAIAAATALDGFEARLIYPGGTSAGVSGPGSATQISTVESQLYGDYEARMRGAKGANYTEGAVSALFTYANDGVDWDGDGLADNHEIDIELSATERSVLYLTVWTDYDIVGGEEAFHRVGARVDLATGEVLATPPGGETGWDTVASDLGFSVPDFNHTARYHTYGFAWRADGVTFWIDLEDGAGRRALFSLAGSAADFIPSLPSPVYLNVWRNSVNWYTRAYAPPPSTNAIFRVDYVRALPPSEDCTTDLSCEDGDPCNGFEVCHLGECGPGPETSCDDGAGACSVDTCVPLDPSMWECLNAPIACDDADPCTIDHCDPTTGCATSPVVCPSGQVCDGGACVAGAACAAAGAACAVNGDCCSSKCRLRSGARICL